VIYLKVNSIKCKVIDVRTESGICVGLAKTKKGEEYIIDGRTPESEGMCSNAFCAISNSAFVMMSTSNRPDEYKDRVCPHGVVPYRLSQSDQSKVNAYNEKE
jgi:hypothetical protein